MVNRHQLADMVDFFCNLQKTTSKEEAFLKGYLAGLGGYFAAPKPNWDALLVNAELFVPIEAEMQEMFKKIHLGDIQAAKSLLAEMYAKEGREVPEWVKNGSWGED